MRMAQLTRWVLAHKRIVVIFWVVLTLVGMASAGSATKALKQKISVPGKEGWVTNEQIKRDFHGTGGNASPLLAVVTLPAGASVDSPAAQQGLRAVESRLQSALPGTRLAGYASTHSRRLPLRRPAARRSSSPTPRPTPASRSKTTPRPRKEPAPPSTAPRGGRPGPSDRLRRAVGAERRRQRARGARRGAAGRLRSAAGARLRVRVVPRDRADHDGGRLDPHDVPGGVGPDDRSPKSPPSSSS